MALKGAMVGFGAVAEHTHWPVWSGESRVAITGVVEQTAARVKRAQELIPGVRIFDTLDDLLATGEVDFIDVCTPPALHTRAALAAAARGVHVLCEKPLCVTRDEMAALRATAGGAAIVPVHNWLHAPQIAFARERVSSGAIGEPLLCTWSTLRHLSDPGAKDGMPNWRDKPEVAGGGIVMDHGWHGFTIAMALLGGRPRRVSARVRTLRPGKTVEDTASIQVEFDHADAQIFLSWAAGVRANGGSVVGRDGLVIIEDARVVVRSRSGSEEIRDFPEALSQGSIHVDWLRPVIDGFLGEIGDPAQRGRGLAEAEAALGMALATYRSSAAGGAAVEVALG